MNVIVDYQAGNLANLKNALNYLGLDNQIASNAKTIEKASRILMPGVGAFQPAMESLRQSGMVEAILEKIDAGVPFFGNLPRLATFVYGRSGRWQTSGTGDHRRGGSPLRT
jgi:glutamine amidotransferase